ncbi:hypothetical protein [Myroides odoratimimus]|uniref:hypothetical protein n=1 Tax=Myroides odoratimimus TaxID=76832 RepID=UPI002578D028|nr:hypothetical protein [Myroides odoratimimus]MDM1536384.1 hypothetical protein [Myroides odoratimimus]MDM1676048.1 hypothetical protein [Myroides odoratimimus]
MMIAEVKVYYAKDIRVVLQGRTFKEVMELIWTAEPFAKYTPLKMVFTATGQLLFLDPLAYSKYAKGEITQEELIRLTGCDDIYRNKKTFTTPDFYTVEKGNIWMARKKVLSLVDHPEITAPLDLEVFELVEPDKYPKETYQIK